jgi:hypothetical protein
VTPDETSAGLEASRAAAGTAQPHERTFGTSDPGAPPRQAAPDPDIGAVLREVVWTLGEIERTPCSPGERRAAEWLGRRLAAVRGVEVSLEDEPSWGTFPPTATGLGLLGMAGAAQLLRGRRLAGGLTAAAAFLGIVDEAQNGPRLLRRLARRRRRTVNVVGRVGEGPSVRATLVVLAHHDAPQTGVVFDQTWQRKAYEYAPRLLERVHTAPPNWWLGLAGPLASVVGSLLPPGRVRRRLGRTALGVGALGTVLVADMWRSQTVPGANDNLSAVAALAALAELLQARPLPGLRVLLVSCGAEETLQDGIRAFVARHRGELDPASTWFVNLDTIGSPHLVMLEAEGPVWMEYYTGAWLRDLVAEHAARLGIELWRGYRARASTDGIIPSRAGYPTATLLSMTDWFAPANYHLASDTPANLDFDTVAEAVRLVYELGSTMARHGAAAPSPALA